MVLLVPSTIEGFDTQRSMVDLPDSNRYGDVSPIRMVLLVPSVMLDDPPRASGNSSLSSQHTSRISPKTKVLLLPSTIVTGATPRTQPLTREASPKTMELDVPSTMTVSDVSSHVVNVMPVIGSAAAASGSTTLQITAAPNPRLPRNISI